jgi:tetratricopeptide (TPR) repeat protein
MARLKICIIFCFFLTVYVYSQTNTGRFYITGRVKVDKGVVEGASIQIVRDGIKWKDVTVNRTGSFRLPVSLGHIYDFIYHKEGYYSKTIEVDTHVPPGTCDGECDFPPYQLAVLLYQKVPGVSKMETPKARVSYNQKIDNFDAEILREASDYSDEIRSVLSDVKVQSERYEERRGRSRQNKYEALIESADRMFRQGDYDTAIRNYRDALMIFPANTYPRNQINKSYQLQVAQQLKKRFGLPDEENFMRYLNYADIKANEREYTMAKVAYGKALSVKPDDEHVKNSLEKVNAELENMNSLAMAEVDHDIKVYRAREKKYQNLIRQADEKIQNEDFAEARQLYTNAATQIDKNSYALLMIEKIDSIFNNEELIQKLDREREAEEQERLREARNRAYNDAVQEADRLFKQRLYRDAIEYYELALSVKNYELYPKKQIRTIREILADLQLKGEEYNRLIRQADNLFQNKNYSDARPK